MKRSFGVWISPNATSEGTIRSFGVWISPDVTFEGMIWSFGAQNSPDAAFGVMIRYFARLGSFGLVRGCPFLNLGQTHLTGITIATYIVLLKLHLGDYVAIDPARR